MLRLIAGEFHKLATTRLWLWLLLAAMAVTALYTSLSLAFSTEADTWTLPLTTLEGQRTLLSIGAGGGAPLAAVLGAIGLTSEFRHRTATTTFLATPHRGRVVVAKLVAYAVAGAGFGVACSGVVLGIAWPWLAAKDIPLMLADGAPTLAGVVVAVAVFGMLGVGLGSLVREQVATVVGLLIYLFVVEPILTGVGALESVAKFLPGSARSSLTQVSLTNADFLEPWQGGVVLVGYGLLFAILGTFLAMRRDVT